MERVRAIVYWWPEACFAASTMFMTAVAFGLLP